MKAIPLCKWKGSSLAAPLLDPTEGLIPTGEGSLSGDPFLEELSSVNLESTDMGEQFSSHLL